MPTREAAAIPRAPGNCCRGRKPRTPTTWCSGSPTSRGATAMSSCSGCPTWPSASTPSPPCSRRRCGRSARGKASPTRIATSHFPAVFGSPASPRCGHATSHEIRGRPTPSGRCRSTHPLRDDFWRSLTPDLSAIKVPMLVCGSFSDNNLHSRGSIRAFTRAGCEPRPPLHPPRRQMGDVLLRSRAGRTAQVLPRRIGRRARFPQRSPRGARRPRHRRRGARRKRMAAGPHALAGFVSGGISPAPECWRQSSRRRRAASRSKPFLGQPHSTGRFPQTSS